MYDACDMQSINAQQSTCCDQRPRNLEDCFIEEESTIICYGTTGAQHQGDDNIIRQQTWLMLTERSQQSKGSCSFARMSSGVDSACHRLGAGAYLQATW